MNLDGGKRGLLVNSENLCSQPQFANALFIGHDNVGARLRPRMEASCGKQKKPEKARKAVGR